MHISGKILLGFILITAALGVFLSGRLLKQRGEVNKKYEAALSTAQSNSDALAKAEVEYNEAKIKMQAASLGWEDIWPAQGTPQFDPQSGVFIRVDLGQNQGLIARQTDQTDANNQPLALNPIVYCFGFPNPGDPSQVQYIGEFRVSNLQAQSSVLQPTWRIEPIDYNKFNRITQFRIRSQVPHHLKRRISKLHVRRVDAQQSMIDHQLRIDNQKRLMELSHAELDIREQELLGNPQAERREDRPEDAIGLNEAIAEVEEIRNSLQFDVDELRRQIKDQKDLREQLLNDLKGSGSNSGSGPRLTTRVR